MVKAAGKNDNEREAEPLTAVLLADSFSTVRCRLYYKRSSAIATWECCRSRAIVET